MTDLLQDLDAPSDAELISRVRGGDVAAYGDLFSRHVDAARRLSRQLVRGPDADDLVSDAFAKVLSVLQGGGGPDVAFRAYLLTAVRRLHVDKIRAGAKLQSSDDMELFDPGVPFQDTAVEAFESGAAAKAFASLPERWQLVLWHLEVEGQKPAEIAQLLGMSPNSVSALAYRAREGLRQAFLTMHLSDISETDCRWVNEHLGAYVRDGLSKRDGAKVQGHLDECRRCTAMYLELTEVNSNLRGIIAPLLLGAAAAGYLSSTGAAAGGGFGLVALFGRARDAVSANAGVASAGVVAAGVAAVATAGIMLLPSSEPGDVIGADNPITAQSTPGDPGTDEPGGSDDDRQPGDGDTTGIDEALPSELPGVTDSPSASAADAPSDAASDQPGDGTSQSPGDGTTSPGEPGPSEPGPTEPGPTEEPPPPPPPTEEPPPPPTEEPPPPPPPVTYTLVAGPATISDGQVSFDFTGDPLPPTVYLQIESPPAGITFDPAGGGTCVRVDPLLAECSTAPDAAPAVAPLARLVTAVAGDSVQVSMPLAGTPEVDTEVTIALSAPLGTVLDRVTALYDVPELAPDVSLSGFPTTVSPTGVHDYLVTGTLGITDYTGGVALTLSDADGRARFADGGVDGCDMVSPQRVECSSPIAGAVSLPIYVQDNRVDDTSVRITVTPLAGTTDTNPENDSVTVVLERYVPIPVDAAVSATKVQSGNSGKAEVTAVVTSDDPKAPVTLTVAYDPTIAPAPAGCSATAGGATCDATGGGSFTFVVDVLRLKNTPRAGALDFRVTVPEEYGDTDPGNDTATEEVTRFEEVTEGSTATSGEAPTLLRESTGVPSARSTPTTEKTLRPTEDPTGSVRTKDTVEDKGKAKDPATPAKPGKALAKGKQPAGEKPKATGPGGQAASDSDKGGSDKGRPAKDGDTGRAAAVVGRVKNLL